MLTKVAFELDASYLFIVASCVIESGLEVEAFGESMCLCFSLGCRARVGKMCRDCELEISEILLMVDPGGDRIESGVGARYGHSLLLVSVG